MSDSTRRNGEPVVYTVGSLADDVDLIGMVRRYERFAADVDQRLKDIELLIRQDREAHRDQIEDIKQDVAALRSKKKK